MRVGIDFGTTRTVVAVVDRGNYPVVSFDDEDGDGCDHFPSVVADDGGVLVYGFAALAAAKRGAPLLRSFKRALASVDVNAGSTVAIGERVVPLLEVMTGFLSALKAALLSASNAPTKKKAKKKKKDDEEEEIEAVVAVPAHAFGAQRFLTLEAFVRAGFVVKAMINEPSAAGFEYTHRQPKAVTQKRDRVVVYDLGGGTFDASVVQVDAPSATMRAHDVVATAGDNHLGGDDFDALLLGLACARANVSESSLSAADADRLREQCREAKERLMPQSKRIPLEVPTPTGDRAVSIAVDEFFAAATPLLERSLSTMKPLLSNDDDIAGVYLVGGASGLPLVPRLLKERFGRRVHRSPHPGASTAIGLAIAADADAGFSLRDRLSRGFGVFREKNAGAAVRFDPIFLPTSPLPVDEPVVVVRRYRAAHNLGWFRYVECSAVDEANEPRGEIAPFAEVLFPFDPALRAANDLKHVDVERRGAHDGPHIEERYTINAHGIVEVEIADLDTGFAVTRKIGA